MIAAMLHVVPKREQKRGRFSLKRERGFLLGKESMMPDTLGLSSFFYSKVCFPEKIVFEIWNYSKVLLLID
jgi:hypothetical protein